MFWLYQFSISYNSFRGAGLLKSSAFRLSYKVANTPNPTEDAIHKFQTGIWVATKELAESKK